MGERESCNAPEVLHIGHPTAACGETGKNATAHSICGDCVQAVAFRLKAGRAAAQTMRDACTAVEHDLRASWDCCSTCRGRIEALDRLRDYANQLDPQGHEHEWVEHSTFREPHTHFICKSCKAERTESRSQDRGQA